MIWVGIAPKELHINRATPFLQRCRCDAPIRPVILLVFKTKSSKPNPPLGWERRPCVCGGRVLGKSDEKQLENMQGSPKGC